MTKIPPQDVMEILIKEMYEEHEKHLYPPCLYVWIIK